MFKVRVRFDNKESKTVTKLTGFCKVQPRIGHDFEVFLLQRSNKIKIINVGKVFNIKYCGELLIVQTDMIVAEVWLSDPRQEMNGPAVVLPFKRPESKKDIKSTLVSERGRTFASSKETNLLTNL